MIINGKRRTMMREFIDGRIVKALNEHSHKLKKKEEIFMLLHESEFSNIRQDILSSMEEYLTYDFWDDKDLVRQS